MAMSRCSLLSIAVATLVLASFASASDKGKKVIAHPPPKYQPVCFRKVTNCCYKMLQCGYEDKVVKFEKPLEYKVCKPKCEKVCVDKPKKVLKEVCEEKKVKIDVKCDHYHGKCEAVYGTKKYCVHKWVVEKEKICKNKCKVECEMVHAVQVYHRLVRYAKFCPVLDCEKEKLVGPYKRPEHIVAEKGKEIKVVPGKKIIKSVKPIENEKHKDHMKQGEKKKADTEGKHEEKQDKKQ